VNKVPREIKHKYPGSWLFSKQNLEWLFIPELSSQLPVLLRFFSFYAKSYFKRTGNDYFIGGRNFFLRIAKINRFFGVNFGMIELAEYKIYVDFTDPRFLNVINELHKVKPVTGVLGTLLKKGDTFIDVGANHGSFSLIAGRYVGKNGLVVAIEAQPRMGRIIELSLSKNLNCKFLNFNTAVGDTDGEVEFLIPNDTSGAAGLFKAHSAKHKHRRVRVSVKRFDDLTDWRSFPGNVIVKLDIEGSEPDFLKGARNMIKSRKPVILVEINPQSMKASGTKPEEFKELLKELGYRYYSNLETPSDKNNLEELNMSRFGNVILFM